VVAEAAVVGAAVEAVEVAEAAPAEAGCMWAAAVQEPGPCDPAPASLAMKDILNPCVQAVAAVEEEEADPEELYS
jgi:hypothetical protein